MRGTCQADQKAGAKASRWENACYVGELTVVLYGYRGASGRTQGIVLEKEKNNSRKRSIEYTIGARTFVLRALLPIPLKNFLDSYFNITGWIL